MNQQPAVIVCETSGRWAAAIKRHLPSTVRVVETRWLAEGATALAESPASVVAVELTARNVAAVLEFVVEADASFPLARVVVLAPSGLDGYEVLIREAGAMHFARSAREFASAAGTICNHLARAPRPRMALAGQVWESLPWGNGV